MCKATDELRTTRMATSLCSVAHSSDKRVNLSALFLAGRKFDRRCIIFCSRYIDDQAEENWISFRSRVIRGRIYVRLLHVSLAINNQRQH